MDCNLWPNFWSKQKVEENRPLSNLKKKEWKIKKEYPVHIYRNQYYGFEAIRKLKTLCDWSLLLIPEI